MLPLWAAGGALRGCAAARAGAVCGGARRLQEVAKYIGDAHGLEWADLVEGAIQEIRSKMQGAEDAGDIAAAAIAKMMNKPH